MPVHSQIMFNCVIWCDAIFFYLTRLINNSIFVRYKHSTAIKWDEWLMFKMGKGRTQISYPILYPISYHILSHPILSYPIISYHIISHISSVGATIITRHVGSFIFPQCAHDASADSKWGISRWAQQITWVDLLLHLQYIMCHLHGYQDSKAARIDINISVTKVTRLSMHFIVWNCWIATARFC